MNPLFPAVLFSSGKLLLLGSGSISLGLSFYKNEPLERPFVRMAAATMLLFFFDGLLHVLFGLSDQLTIFFEHLGRRDGLKELIVDALKHAAQPPGGTSNGSRYDLPGAIEQIWRTGVWGVVSILAECFFLLSSLLLEIGRDITLQLIWILYPLVIGMAPLFPGVVANFLTHVLCVCLWWPLFTLITVVTSVIARNYMAHTNSWGLSILALEVIACLMTCAVPVIAQRLIAGAISQTSQHLSVSSFQSQVTNRVQSATGRPE